MHRAPAQSTQAAILAVSIFVLASASIVLTRFDGGAAFLWPATAPLFACLATRHPRSWLYPMIASGAASWAASTLFGVGVVAGFPIAIAIVAEGALGALILRAAGEGMASLDALPSLGMFVVAAGIVAPAVCGLLGAGVLAWSTSLAFWPNWWAWFAAHSLGTVSVAPLLLLYFRGEGGSWLQVTRLRRKAEAAMLLATVAGISFGVFAQTQYPLLFLPFLPLIVTTFRLGRLGAAGSIVILGAIGSVLTVRGDGPISLMHVSLGARAQFFQLYLAVAVMVVLPVAAELRRRDGLTLRIRQSEAAFRLLAENLGDTLIHTSLDGDVRYASPAILTLTGYRAAEVVGRNSRNFVLADDFDRFKAARDQAIADPETTVNVEYRARIRDDIVVWCETRIRSHTDERGNPVGIILVVRDVTARKATEAELALEATTDALTGLPNRRAFFDRFHYLQHEVAAGRGVGCIAIFDIDFFKLVNDAHGHITGDNVLKAVAAAASIVIRSGDMVARVGGEEFAIVLWGATRETAAQTCERVRTNIEGCAVHATTGACVAVTASFGIAEIKPGSASDAIYHAADEALYAAKSQGRNRLQIAA